MHTHTRTHAHTEHGVVVGQHLLGLVRLAQAHRDEVEEHGRRHKDAVVIGSVPQRVLLCVFGDRREVCGEDARKGKNGGGGGDSKRQKGKETVLRGGSPAQNAERID